MSDIFEEIFNNLVLNKKPENNNFLIILAGLPYSGKSTFAEKLSNHNFVHFWTTKIKKQYQLNDSEVLKLSEKIIEKLLEKNYNIVFDFLNHKNEQRESIYSIAEKMNKRYFIFYLNTPKNIILERQARVIENVGRSSISPEIIREIESEFEVPTGSNVVEIINNFDLEKFISSLKN
jgi:tRNA uridine 5-carbamoylmethylation protein Kti12